MTYIGKVATFITFIVVAVPTATYLAWRITFQDRTAPYVTAAAVATMTPSSVQFTTPAETDAPMGKASTSIPETSETTMPRNAVAEQITVVSKSTSGNPKADVSGDARLNELAEALAKDPQARREVIQRFRQSSDEAEKKVIKALLSKQLNPEVIAFSKELVSSNRDAERREGFELLSTLPPSAEGYRALAQALEQEQDRSVLIFAVATTLARPSREPIAESQVVVQQLRRLSQSDDSSVRRLSVRALPQWDRSE